MSAYAEHVVKTLPTAAITFITTAWIMTTMATEFFVAPDGSDADPGTLQQPFRSIAKAQLAVRESGALSQQPVTVHLRAGTHYLSNTLVFTPADSGSADAPVRYVAHDGEDAVVSGGFKLDLEWTPYRDEILQAKTPAGLEMDQLFVNGARLNMARYPDHDPNVRVFNGYAEDAFSRERAARWKDPAGGYMHAIHRALWGGFHYRITGKDEDDELTYEGGWQNNRQMGMHKSMRMVENIFEELDAPGEWFHNADMGVLYVYPPEGVALEQAEVVTVQLAHLVDFVGSKAKQVRWLALEGITFRHAARTFMRTREPLLRSDWTIYRGGAVTLTAAAHCRIADCFFDSPGGNAIFVNKWNRQITVKGTHFREVGASAVAFVGSPDAVRDPKFEYRQQNRYDEIDMTPGPTSDDYPADCLVEDCLMARTGRIEKQGAGVQISMAHKITVRHCSIYDTSRAGINISEGTFGGHVIEFCDVFDTVRETGDHGSFNSWGRDRFWHLEGAPDEKLPELSKLDILDKTVIRNSRWRCDHGWDVDLDDGSSHYEIYNNLMLHGGLKMREGFGRKVYNNITVNNALHPHVWYPECGDEVTGNIWMTAYRPAVMKTQDQFSGAKVDRNMFVSEDDRAQFAGKGWDKNSIVGDPMFVDPESGDYRVGEESPFLAFGFRNFPMDHFGVQKHALKAIARVPEFPTPRTPEPTGSSDQTSTWLGTTVKALTGDAYSAFGVSKEEGGIHLVTVPAKSQAAAAGLKAGDVVQKVNGHPTTTVAELERLTEVFSGKPLTVSLVRGQQEMALHLP